jgi:hypothetical protein
MISFQRRISFWQVSPGFKCKLFYEHLVESFLNAARDGKKGEKEKGDVGSKTT